MAKKYKLPAFKSGPEYGKGFKLPMSRELTDAMMKHEKHHSPESHLDSKVVPYSIMDEKHKGRR